MIVIRLAQTSTTSRIALLVAAGGTASTMTKASTIAPLVVMGITCGAAVLFMYASAARERRRDYRRILADGVRAPGTIARIDAANRAGRCRTTFEFEPGETGRRVAISQGTTAEAVRRLGLMPGTAVAVQFLPKSPKAAFIPALALAEQGTSRTMAADSRESSPATYFVSFTAPGQSSTTSSRYSNPFRWFGQGFASVTDRGIRFTAKRARLFRSPGAVDREIELADVSNVEVFGNAVSLVFAEPDCRPKPVKFWTVDAREAAEIAARLPAIRTDTFSPAMAEADAFLRRLKELAPATPVTTALVATNVAIFLVAAALGAGVLVPNPEILVRLGSDFTPLTVNGQWWRLFTSTFLHFGVFHVAFNMWALYANGPLAERLFGSARYLLIYIVAGLAGSALSLWWHPVVNGAGASGAIFGMFGALLAFFLRRPGGIPASVITRHRNSIAVFIAYNLLNGVSHRAIDNAAHTGGLAAGFLLGLLLTRPLDAERSSAVQEYRWAVGIAAAVLLGFGASFLNSPSQDELASKVADFVPGTSQSRAPAPAAAQQSRSSRQPSAPLAEVPLDGHLSTSPLTTLAGITVGESRAELLRNKGRPIMAGKSVWLYRALDEAHDGTVKVSFVSSAARPDATVERVFYEGNATSPPPELPLLLGVTPDRLYERLGSPIARESVDDADIATFANGLVVKIQRGTVRGYGVRDISTLHAGPGQ